MSRRMGRLLAATLAATLAVGLGISAGAAFAAPGPQLKQFKVPTANSEPRDITNGSDGNRWFTEGTDFTNAPAKIGRITPAGAVTEFEPTIADGCNFCILTDIKQGQGDLVYITSNDAFLMRFNVQTLTFETPVQMPNSSALAGQLAVHGDLVFITDFNNHVVWRYNTVSGVFDSFPADPADIAVDAAGNAWFTETQQAENNNTNIARIDAVTGEVTRTVVAPAARDITVSPVDGKVWFAVRFQSVGVEPQGVGYLDPAANNAVTFFPTLSNPGPNDIIAAPDGTIWFTQESKGNTASVTNAGVITEGKVVKGSQPAGITVAPNGDPWYAMRVANKIATLQLQ